MEKTYAKIYLNSDGDEMKTKKALYTFGEVVNVSTYAKVNRLKFEHVHKVFTVNAIDFIPKSYKYVVEKRNATIRGYITIHERQLLTV
jgi:hypothetical protein